MKLLVGFVALIALSGCGKFDRWWVGMTGDAVETCKGGVMYYQFTSGATPAYRPDGTLITCREQ